MLLQLPDLSPLACLKKLDLSINQLRSMATLSTLQASALKEVYITSNKVSTIEVWLFVVRCTGNTTVHRRRQNATCQHEHYRIFVNCPECPQHIG